MIPALGKLTVTLSCPLVLPFLLGWASAAPVVAAATDGAGMNLRKTMNLDGHWDFAADPEEAGQQHRWFAPDVPLPVKARPGYAPRVNGKILVPGIWDNQGYGTETEKARHNFVGKAWYKRQITVPSDWAGRRLFLRITGAHRYAKVWVGSQCLGEHVGYLSPFECEITDCVKAGQPATVTIQVDSKQRWDVDTMYGASDLADYMDIAWGGIWGHVLLEARTDAWLNDLFVQPRTSPAGCKVSALLRGMNSAVAAVNLELFDTDDRTVVRQSRTLDAALRDGGRVEVTTELPGAHLWTPDTPVLYRARLSLAGKNGQMLDGVVTRFGFREIKLDGPHILLNGNRMFLRGYGDDHIYPQQMAMPADKSLYLDRLRLVKSYGFNHVRHHSTILPPEYYDACDEIGILSTAEFPIAYQEFYERASHSPAAQATYRREWSAAIACHRNHPSILCWVMGNELWAGVPLNREFQTVARRLDPTRPFADSDGLFKDFILSGDRDTLDLWFTMFDVSRIPLDVPDKFVLPRTPTKPVISHETGNYNTFPRLDQFTAFGGTIKPFWTVEGRRRLDELGLSAEAPRWADNSERLYLLCHKLNIEALRKSPHISGHHWWLFQDYWTTSNGIVDFNYRPKSIRAEDVRQFINDVVLLVDGLDVTYRGKGRLKLDLLVSNYSPLPLAGIALTWRVRAGERLLGTQDLVVGQVAQGDVSRVGKIEFALPDVAEPTPITIEADLPLSSGRCCNAWRTWLYPSHIGGRVRNVPVFAASDFPGPLGRFGVRAMPDDDKLEQRAVYVASSIEPRLLDAAAGGACLVLLGTTGLWPSSPATFKPSWWKGADEGDNNCGTVVYDHTLTRGMAPGGWCDSGWYHLLQGASRYQLEGLPQRPGVIVRAVPHLHMVRDNAFLFEARVGPGSLLVSGLNHAAARGRPEGEWLLSRLLDYAATLPQLPAEIPMAYLRGRLPAQPPPGPYCRGFCKLIGTPAETGTWFSYYDDNAKVYICRQTRLDDLLQWQTETLPAEIGRPKVTFRFAGGLGYVSQPKTEGFVLLVNGREVLRFDLGDRLKWASADGRIVLELIPSRKLPEDRVGQFYLTVSRDLLKPSEPCRLAVRSLGGGSRRWFGLNPDRSEK
jgi:beta-galactosidase